MLSNSCEGLEVDRYPHFINAANEGLRMLKTVRHPGMRGPNTDLEILFCCNDPLPIEGTHGHPRPFTTSRKPDIVATSLRAAIRAADRENQGETWDTIVKTAATARPLKAFRWPFILSSVEMKAELRYIAAHSFHLSTLAQMPPPIPPQTTSPDSKKRASSGAHPPSPTNKRRKFYNECCMPDESALQSSPSMPGASCPTVALSPPRRSTRSTGFSASHQAPVSPSVDTQNPTVVPEEEVKVPPMVQCGTYAAEMLCGSLGALHCFN